MQRDYYALRQTELSASLTKLEQVAAVFDEARKQGDREARRKAEAQMKQAAKEAVGIEPHLAYLWYKSCASEFDNSIRDTWQESLVASAIPEVFRFTPDISSIAHMPPLSFMLRVPFRLQKPYLSKDESDFYLLDNPVRKEKIFQTPMVAATSWKGALRAALWQLGYKEDHEAILRLLGNPRDSEEGLAGRLYFYPTFFDKIALEVINPHNRKTGVGERPILMECVPQKTTGTLLLLYVPFGLITQGETERRTDVAQDFEVLTEGIQAMLTGYGFGAKTSSGFGLAENALASKGVLAIRAELPGMTTSTAAPQVAEPPKPDLPRYLESPAHLRADFRRPDQSLKSEVEYEAFVKSRGGRYGKKDKQLYEKARKWWEREGRQLAETATQEPTPEPVPTKTPPVTELTFATLSELCEAARRVAAQLQNGGGG